MAQKILTIQCSECGCKRKIAAQEVPIGDCKFCSQEFGWYYAPPTMPNLKLKRGDVVVINTKIPSEDPNRIFSVTRNSRIIFQGSE